MINIDINKCFICFLFIAVIQYFDRNWHGITEQWVKFHVVQHHMFGNRTNNRLESLNQKIKAVVAKYSTLPMFFHHLM